MHHGVNLARVLLLGVFLGALFIGWAIGVGRPKPGLSPIERESNKGDEKSRIGRGRAQSTFRQQRRDMRMAGRRECRAVRFVHRHFGVGAQNATYQTNGRTWMQIVEISRHRVIYNHTRHAVTFLPECKYPCLAIGWDYDVSEHWVRTRQDLERLKAEFEKGEWHDDNCPSRRQGIQEAPSARETRLGMS